jgi:hypothetical protein
MFRILRQDLAAIVGTFIAADQQRGTARNPENDRSP